MKKIISILIVLSVLTILSGYTLGETKEDESKSFDINNLYDYQKEYKSKEIDVCAIGKTKTYMDYRATTSKSSNQYQFMRKNMYVDDKTGFLFDKDGFIGVALGSFYGEIGDRFYFTLENGAVLPLVKIEEKSDVDTDPTGCYHTCDFSVIEFVIDKDVANEYFGYYGNGLVLQGNYANYPLFNGGIVKVEKVLDEKNDSYVTYENIEPIVMDYSIFNYASGY